MTNCLNRLHYLILLLIIIVIILLYRTIVWQNLRGCVATSSVYCLRVADSWTVKRTRWSQSLTEVCCRSLATEFYPWGRYRVDRMGCSPPSVSVGCATVQLIHPIISSYIVYRYITF